MECIYNLSVCTRKVGSEEHTILQSLGGRKVSKNICCEKCNNFLGAEIDKPFSNRFSELCAIIDVKRQRNKKPIIIKGIFESDGVMFDFSKSTLIPSRYPANKITKIDDNLSCVEIIRSSEKDAVNLLNNVLSSSDFKNASIIKMDVSSISKIVSQKKTWNFNFSTLDFRSVAKTLLTELSTCIPNDALRCGNYKDIINFISGFELNDRKHMRPVHANNLPYREKLSIFQHTVYIRLIPGVGCLGVLSLFNTFTFAVVLSEIWEGQDYLAIHMVDPTTGQTETLKLDNIFEESINDWTTWLYSDQELATWESNPLFFKRESLNKFFINSNGAVTEL